MDYIEIEIDSTYLTISDSTLSPRDTPLINVGRTLSNIAGAKILEVNIPFSFYPITDQINALTNLSENRILLQSSADSVTLIIPPGAYTGTSLAAVIQPLLAAAMVTMQLGFNPTTAPTTGTCTFDISTGKFNFQLTQASDVGLAAPFSFQFASPNTPVLPLATLLGFTSNNVNFTANGPNTVFTLSSTNVAAVTGPNILYINSRILGNVCKSYIPEGALSVGQTNPQMAMVPVNVNPGGIIWWQDPSPNEVFDTQNLFSLSQLDMYVTAGTDPRPLLFNGLGFQVKLMLFVKNKDQGLSQSGTLGQNRVITQIRPT